MSYEDSYNSARSRYYNACSEISNCQSRLNQLNAEKQTTISTINRLTVEINDYSIVNDELRELLGTESSINASHDGVVSSVGEAADTYIGMIEASNIVSKNLSDVFSNEDAVTRSTISTSMETIRSKKNVIETILEQKRTELAQAQTRLEELNASISSTNAELSSWESTKNSAAMDMEYYSRKMAEEAEARRRAEEEERRRAESAYSYY